MPRVFPVADGVLKHQLYYQPGTSTEGAHEDDLVLTVWTYKATGSPVGATRVTAEQDAMMAWVSAWGRALLPTNWQFIDLRTWDYGLDPAPRTRRIFLPIQGTANISSGSTGPMPTRSQTHIVALRTQPVGSTVRNRLNGRSSWPIPYVSIAGFATTYIPSASQVQSAFNALLAAFQGAGNVGIMSLVSYETGGAPRLVPLVTPINHVLVQRFGVQRRRDPKPGPYARGT